MVWGFFLFVLLNSGSPAGPETYRLFVRCKTSSASERSPALALWPRSTISGEAAAALSPPGQAHLTALCPPSPGGPTSARQRLPSLQGRRAVFRRGSSKQRAAGRWLPPPAPPGCRATGGPAARGALPSEAACPTRRPAAPRQPWGPGYGGEAAGARGAFLRAY